MVETVRKKVCTSIEKLPQILDGLEKYGAQVEDRNDGEFYCEVQSNNTIYKIEIYTFYDPADMLNIMSLGAIPVDSFEDLQTKLLGKIVWDWKK